MFLPVIVWTWPIYALWPTSPYHRLDRASLDLLSFCSRKLSRIISTSILLLSPHRMCHTPRQKVAWNIGVLVLGKCSSPSSLCWILLVHPMTIEMPPSWWGLSMAHLVVKITSQSAYNNCISWRMLTDLWVILGWANIRLSRSYHDAPLLLRHQSCVPDRGFMSTQTHTFPPWKTTTSSP